MSYDYHAPTTVAEAQELMRRWGDEAHLVAGATAFVLLWKQGLLRPGHVVGLRGIEALGGIARTADGGLRIGALVTHREAERSSEVRAYCPALADAFAKVATIRVRNQATVGGNIAHADPAQDPPTILSALGAEALVASHAGERAVPLGELFVDYFTTSLVRGEIITALRLPALPVTTRATYLKFLPRTADDYATVSVAATANVRADGMWADVSVVLGAVGPTPLRARAVAAALRGRRPTPKDVAAAAALVRDVADPLDDGRGSAAYKREMARVWTERALLALRGADA